MSRLRAPRPCRTSTAGGFRVKLPMMSPAEAEHHAYDATYHVFDSPLTRRLREEAYGEDIGQHSWVTAAELREDIPRLRLSVSSRLLDLGCGPCGPLTFIVSAV